MELNSISSTVMDNKSVQPAATPVEAVKVNPPQAEAPVASPDLKAPQEAVQLQIEQVNSKLEQMDVGLAFSVDENTQSSVVKLVDKSTDEVIKQYPNEESLKMMKNIQDYLNSVQQSVLSTKEGLKGVLLNEII
jgi:flagellar protein FlaG